MTKAKMKKTISVVNAVRYYEKRDNSRTATLASITDAMTVIEQSKDASDLNFYLLDNSSYAAEFRILTNHTMDAAEKEAHLLRVMQALIEYDEYKGSIGTDTAAEAAADAEEDEEEEYW